MEQFNMHDLDEKRYRRRKQRPTASESPARDYRGGIPVRAHHDDTSTEMKVYSVSSFHDISHEKRRRRPEEGTSNVPNVVISRTRDDEVKAGSDVERTEETSAQVRVNAVCCIGIQKSSTLLTFHKIALCLSIE
ncbi:unnamed protein product [Cylicostephanus goldi]|uniref:Uncharacterized protein n=1 Tax=Cylicostephanus goldi TaxID=71465 RepID=A0A3P6R1Z3_CYLGO|nr:unnamed protein product [Cylicostephanus goldi]